LQLQLRLDRGADGRIEGVELLDRLTPHVPGRGAAALELGDEATRLKQIVADC